MGERDREEESVMFCHSKARLREKNGLRGASPLAGVLVLGGVGIVLAIAIVFAFSPWIQGSSTSNTRYAQIEIKNAYAVRVYNEGDGNSGWIIKVNLVNTGAADATIDNLLINEKPLSEFSEGVKVQTALPIRVSSGQTETIVVEMMDESRFSSGMMIEIKLNTAMGASFIEYVDLR